ARRGVGRVVWPVQFEALADDRRLARVGVAFDRALLAARLLSVDTRQSMGQSVVIHTPFAELTDDQLLDLAADMDVPVGLAWWCERQADDKPVCGSCGPCRRWSVAMTRAGVVPAVSGLPWSLVEEKPSVTTSV
ncbi:MAG: 7-cyano-7-deazaguanine synthase, partial [Phycisphaerales bacterium]|nr:7-cyano-7-deazaguanine synthase [Phycisphaerales bacterium]